MASEYQASDPDRIEFEHERIDPNPPCGRLGICQCTDLTGNGQPDIIVGGAGAEDVPVLGTEISRNTMFLNRVLQRVETYLFWYENPGWERHTLCPAPGLNVFGNALGDVDGDGKVDLIAAQALGDRNIFWFEQPPDPRDTWDRHVITDRFHKHHDIAYADVDDDGEPEVVGTSQESEAVFYFDVPEDPYQEPWPEECLHVVDQVDVEGLEVVDIDGDGKTEIIAGTNIYHRDGDSWEREQVVEGWDWTRIAVEDLDDDGDLEIVFTEGDSPHLGSHPGRVAWFDPPDWEQHTLRDDMFCPHTLQIADFTGDGRPDIFVAEMGLGKNDDPEHVLFANQGDGTFQEHLVGQGIPTHEAKAIDMTGDGRPDIVGKSYEPTKHVDVWYNRS